jgi:hypothetical protein
MPVRVVAVERTPNPNARKFVLSAPVSDRPRSFRTREAGEADSQAAPLFAVPGVTVVLISDGWISVNKAAQAAWPNVERGVREAIGRMTPLAGESDS